ncbi:MAG: oligosaccharide flippase family protein [bacterium]|nr:oligosaccharide flippase family protein [bacterium]
MTRLKITSNLLARNTLLNLGGNVAALLVGVVTIPAVVRGLGTERFGLLALAWAVLGYTTIFDLGLGRATARFGAEALGQGRRETASAIVWTVVPLQLALQASLRLSLVP